MNISNIMKTQIETIQAKESVKKASEQMYKLGIRHLPVLEGKQLVGLLSDRDVALATRFTKDDQTLKNVREDLKVEDLMTLSPVVLSPLDSVEKAMELAIDKKFGAFPVLEKDQLVGIVTVIDLLQVGLKSLQGK